MIPPPTHDSLRARLARLARPGAGWCLRCGMPWGRVDGHVTPYGRGRGMFPLCVGCHALLGHPEARIEYYAALARSWGPGSLSADERSDLTRAVAAGL